MLTSEQAKKNQEKYGFNELTEGNGTESFEWGEIRIFIPLGLYSGGKLCYNNLCAQGEPPGAAHMRP